MNAFSFGLNRKFHDFCDLTDFSRDPHNRAYLGKSTFYSFCLYNRGNVSERPDSVGELRFFEKKIFRIFFGESHFLGKVIFGENRGFLRKLFPEYFWKKSFLGENIFWGIWGFLRIKIFGDFLWKFHFVRKVICWENWGFRGNLFRNIFFLEKVIFGEKSFFGKLRFLTTNFRQMFLEESHFWENSFFGMEGKFWRDHLLESSGGIIYLKVWEGLITWKFWRD